MDMLEWKHKGEEKRTTLFDYLTIKYPNKVKPGDLLDDRQAMVVEKDKRNDQLNHYLAQYIYVCGLSEKMKSDHGFMTDVCCVSRVALSLWWLPGLDGSRCAVCLCRGDSVRSFTCTPQSMSGARTTDCSVPAVSCSFAVLCASHASLLLTRFGNVLVEHHMFVHG